MTPRLAAVIVTYGAGADRAGLLVSALRDVAQQIIVVDNTPGAAAPRIDGADGLANGNIGGLAGAYNRALQHLGAAHLAGAADLVVFVDQDSDPSVLPAMLADPQVMALLQRDDVAAVAPAYRDRATGLRGRPAVLTGRWKIDHLPRDFDDLRRTTLAINSMTIWRMPALAVLGPFDEGLGVDHVDTDMALRAADAGLSIWIAGQHVFDHAIGARRTWRAFGRDFQTTDHPPIRRQAYARNITLLARRWGRRYPAFAGLTLARLGYEAAGIIAAEDQRRAKLGALVRGIWAGLFIRD